MRRASSALLRLSRPSSGQPEPDFTCSVDAELILMCSFPLEVRRLRLACKLFSYLVQC
jgi:hypothetical protein